MGRTKEELFTVQQNKLAKMAKAIAHPARIAILEQLSQNGACACGDLVDVLPLSQSTISQHLKAMKESGIIKGEIEGTFRCYCIDMQSCKELMNKVASLFAGCKCC